ncbi:restriction endonuclease [methanogenic archaeon mixed culture ISO4-G1]|nr:restriction endonuclease [methanogenic archaeon mixed culture ISO4-G1]
MVLWVCRAGRYGEYENYFLEKGIVAITWHNLTADLTKCKTRDDVKEVLSQIYPDEKKNTISNNAGQLFAFVQTMNTGEKVLLPSKINPGTLYIGTIDSDCSFSGELPYSHIRKVKWSKKTVNRADLDQDICYSLGSLLTIFSIDDDKASRILNSEKTKTIPQEDSDLGISRNLENDALDQISSTIIQKFKGYDMQLVIASIFKAKGYQVYVSKGADKGIDVLASNGPLGFGGTKICIQVKTDDKPIERAILTELKGTMQNVKADYGLLVSWSGFKTSMDAEMRDSFFSIKFWDHGDIVREFLENYEKLDDWIKVKVPLKRIWVIDDQLEAE